MGFQLPTSTGEFAGVLNHQQYLFTFGGTVTSNRNPSAFLQGGLLTSRLVQPLIWGIVSGTPSPTSQIISGNLGLTCITAPQSLMLGLVRNCGVLHRFMTEIRGSEFLHVWIHSVPNMIFICVSLECVFFLKFGQMVMYVLSNRSCLHSFWIWSWWGGWSQDKGILRFKNCFAKETAGGVSWMAFYLRFAGMACRYGLRNVLKSNHVCVCVEVPYDLLYPLVVGRGWLEDMNCCELAIGEDENENGHIIYIYCKY